MSDPGLAASETPRLAVEELGMQLPKPVIDGVQAEPRMATQNPPPVATSNSST